MKQFTFTVNGVKYKYNTVEEMRNAIDKLNKQGLNVDNNSIKIEYIEQPKTFKSLVKLVADNVEDKSELEEDLFVELVGSDIMKVVQDFSKNIQLSKNDFYTLTDIYGAYNHCINIDEVKLYLVIDFITKKLDGVKITFTEFKKMQLKNSL